MKTIISIVLIFVLSYNFIGAGFVYNIWLYSIKNEVKVTLQAKYDKEFKVIKVPKTWANDPPPEFKWHEDHEFRYRGQMYDVIRKEVKGNQIWYYCYWDKAETKLLNNLSKYVSSFLQQQPDHKEKAEHLVVILKKTFLLFEKYYLPNIKLPSLSLIPENIMLVRRFQDVETPPPRDAMHNLYFFSCEF